jgi:hypothetical protein
MLLIHELIHQLLCTGQQPGARAQLVVALSSAEFCCLEALLTSTGRTFNDVSVTDTGDNEVQVLGGGGSPPRITVRELDDNAAALQLDPSWSTSLQDAYVDSVLTHTHTSFIISEGKIKAGFLRRGRMHRIQSRMWMQTRFARSLLSVGENISTHSHTSTMDTGLSCLRIRSRGI